VEINRDRLLQVRAALFGHQPSKLINDMRDQMRLLLGRDAGDDQVSKALGNLRGEVGDIDRLASLKSPPQALFNQAIDRFIQVEHLAYLLRRFLGKQKTNRAPDPDRE
jgi:hypothetical protein